MLTDRMFRFAVVVLVLVGIVILGGLVYMWANSPTVASAFPQELPMVQHDFGFHTVHKVCCLK